MSEMIVIGVIALIFIGPDQIPETARVVGRFINDLRRSTDEVKSHLSKSVTGPLDDISLRPEEIEPWDGKTVHRETDPDVYDPAKEEASAEAKSDDPPPRKGES